MGRGGGGSLRPPLRCGLAEGAVPVPSPLFATCCLWCFVGRKSAHPAPSSFMRFTATGAITPERVPSCYFIFSYLSIRQLREPKKGAPCSPARPPGPSMAHTPWRCLFRLHVVPTSSLQSGERAGLLQGAPLLCPRACPVLLLYSYPLCVHLYLCSCSAFSYHSIRQLRASKKRAPCSPARSPCPSMAHAPCRGLYRLHVVPTSSLQTGERAGLLQGALLLYARACPVLLIELLLLCVSIHGRWLEGVEAWL